MNQPNPYEPPRTVAAENAHLILKARRLLERRHQPLSAIRFFSGQWRRHLVVTICFGLLCVVAWQIENRYLAIGLAAFWAGRIVRDIQWYRTVVLEWESTKELLDWEKIEQLGG